MSEVRTLVVGEIQTNCYLFVSGKELIIIDPGDESEKIISEIGKYKTKPKYIINTHYHYDHVLANLEIKQATGAQILIHESEENFVDFPVDRFLKTGEELKIGDENLKVILTPGHTPGSICLLGDNFIFTGDTIFADGCGRTDLLGGSELEMRNSLARLKQIIKPGMKVYPGHGEVYVA